jgi:tetratricopeptide (TPR) repeat protein
MWLSLAVAIALGAAQTAAPQSQPAIFINGTVKDAAGAVVPAATVILEEKTRSESVEGKTDENGKFSFLALKGGMYIVRVKHIGFRDGATQPMELSVGEKKEVDVVLQVDCCVDFIVLPAEPTASPDTAKTNSAGEAEHKQQTSSKVRPATQEKPDPLQFSDAPNFTVAGVTDWSNAGLHASETNARTSEALNKDTAALKEGASSPAKASTSSEAASHRAAGDVYEAAGEPLKAEGEYEASVRLDPSEHNYFVWGTELLLHRAIQPAVEVFTKGAGAHPESWRMLSGLGAALYASGSYEVAARRLCQASDLQPKQEVPYLFLGKMQKSATDALPCAEEKLARFVRAEPENALANYYYALALWKRARGAENAADLRRQEALLQKAVRVDPKLAEGYLQLGILYEAQNGFDLAVRAYKQAIAANPELGEAHYRLGLAYKRAGDSTKAEQEFALYKQAQEAENAAEELRRKELQQFVIILKQKDNR